MSYQINVFHHLHEKLPNVLYREDYFKQLELQSDKLKYMT